MLTFLVVMIGVLAFAVGYLRERVRDLTERADTLDWYASRHQEDATRLAGRVTRLEIDRDVLFARTDIRDPAPPDPAPLDPVTMFSDPVMT